MKRYALTAIGRDRPGIVAAVTKALYEHDCNIEDSSMTILEDEFAIILIMTLPRPAGLKALLGDLKKVEESMELTIHVKEIRKETAPAGAQSNYIITLHGADKAGIVYKTSALLAEMGINVTDLETKILPGEGRKVYIMVMEVYTPGAVDIKKVEDRLKKLAANLGVTIKIKPVEAYEPL